MHSSEISIKVSLDEQKVPSKIDWKAQDSTVNEWQDAKAMMVSFWDGQDKTALRIDLWNKEMMLDEMADFFYQNFTAMADTFNRATKMDDLTNDIKVFAQQFMQKFKAEQQKNNKVG
jgi:gliding motility-associated protein GldC